MMNYGHMHVSDWTQSEYISFIGSDWSKREARGLMEYGGKQRRLLVMWKMMLKIADLKLPKSIADLKYPKSDPWGIQGIWQ